EFQIFESGTDENAKNGGGRGHSYTSRRKKQMQRPWPLATTRQGSSPAQHLAEESAQTMATDLTLSTSPPFRVLSQQAETVFRASIPGCWVIGSRKSLPSVVDGCREGIP